MVQRLDTSDRNPDKGAKVQQPNDLTVISLTGVLVTLTVRQEQDATSEIKPPIAERLLGVARKQEP